ncbi:MAG: efflux RND transporter periplasmic adaptor subunit [Muribaculaceae bacterium]|nr:efflux RND transporter periplasmic adaptor subunit [Muribaculaceae bacterium]
MTKNKMSELSLKTHFLPAVAMAALMLLTACGSKGDAAGQAAQGGAPVQVETYTVAMGSIDLVNSYPATIKGKTDIEVRPQISGFITRVCVDEGQRVSRGQTLFLIDQVQLQAAVQQAQAAVTSAEAQVATAQLTANNQKQLLDKNIISSYQYETAALNLQAAQATLNQARAALVSARKNLSYSVVTAPSNGVVGSIPNREGSLASPSGPALTTISDINEVYAYFSLNEKQIIALTHSGAISLETAIKQMPTVQLRLSDGSTYANQGRVSTVAGVLNQSTGSASVRALFPNNNGMLRSGASGEVLIPVNSSNVLLIPQKATYELQDMKYVYVVGADGKAVGTPIKVLPENDGKQYVVTEGLKEGDVIVVEGVGTLVRDGVTVASKK